MTVGDSLTGGRMACKNFARLNTSGGAASLGVGKSNIQRDHEGL